MSRLPSDQPPAADARLAQAWRETSRDEPPAALDDAIRAAARQAVHARPRPLAGSPFGGRWRVPLSVAAVLVVSATITLLVAEREKPDSPRLHDQAAPPLAAPAPQTYGGESSAERAREFAEPSAPAANLAPREQELARAPEPAAEERKLQSAPAPPPASAETAQARTLPLEQSPGVQTSAQPGGAVEADEREARRAESSQPAAASVPPASTVERADASLSEAPASPGEPAADLGKREMPAAGRAKQRAAPGAPSAPAKMQAAQEGAAAGRQPEPRAAPAAPAPEGAVAADEQSLEPKAWLDRILELRRQGKLEEAEKSLKAFRERYPGYPLPEELKGLGR